MKLNVSAVVVGDNEGDQPVTVQWGRDLSPVEAAANVATILAANQEPRGDWDPTLLSIEVTVTEFNNGERSNHGNGQAEQA